MIEESRVLDAGPGLACLGSNKQATEKRRGSCDKESGSRLQYIEPLRDSHSEVESRPRIRARITLGADPRAEAKARKAVLTYAEFFEQHYLPHVKLRNRSWDRDEDLPAAHQGGVRQQAAEPDHAAPGPVVPLGARGGGLAAATANHHLKVLEVSLNLARQWGMLEGENPAARIPMLHEDNKIEHYLDEAELQRLAARAAHGPEPGGLPRRAVPAQHRLPAERGAVGDVGRRRHREAGVHDPRDELEESRKLRSVPLNDSAIEVLNELETEARVVRCSQRPQRRAR